jgi:hypothetical protein
MIILTKRVKQRSEKKMSLVVRRNQSSVTNSKDESEEYIEKKKLAHMRAFVGDYVHEFSIESCLGLFQP